MEKIELRDVAKIYPYTQVKGIFGRKKQQELLEKQRSMPYTTNEGVVVLQHIDLQIRAGELVVLLGPSGCGKTTLLRLIAGLEQPSVGSILFDGQDMETVAPEDRDAAMVFQNYSLYPHLTVYDNMAFPLKNMHIPRGELDKRVREMADLLEITQCLGRLPMTLSGGQLQRVAIGRALVKKPKLLLMDEPFSNLDAPLRASLRLLVKKIHKTLGTTILYVTHDQQEALQLGGRILILRDGCILQDGTPGEIYTRPSCLDSALALGSPAMNLLSSLPQGLGEGIPIPPGTGTIGIRPVHLLLTPEGSPATVDYAEPLGSETVLHLKMGDQALTLVTEDQQSFFRGQQVFVKLMKEKLHFFDETGLRI